MRSAGKEEMEKGRKIRKEEEKKLWIRKDESERRRRRRPIATV